MCNQNHAKLSTAGDKPQPHIFFKFPFQFPIKIMASTQKNAIEFILETLKKEVHNPETINFDIKESKTRKYVSITATFEARNKDQIDKLYYLLSTHKEIYMVL